ncbi:N-acetylneuraminate synthase [Oceanidesulfovibrio indonesiensis]|uniref:N-acetylneuraminate synthase n=1 Tax=Oceanidesulfovibrio indonesiensis TaxID=54767 RepID=A0A7M3MJ62_9BACT|nr:N-acetylneuraminate synthase family protein [Oceanidesulfovibrio indonesiensis]TVM19507.1 N-acetylneuraminate synthase [Oceanidesulfovibrio indonesiensis]
MDRSLMLDGFVVNDNAPCYLVAEIGLNHQGSRDTALKLMDAAKASGAHAVKFQKRDPRKLLTREFYDAPYPGEHSLGATYGEHREALELSAEDYEALIEHGRELGITVFATPFDEPSADLLNELGMPFFKIASADLRNRPLQKRIASFGKPVILSTGGGSMDDVRRAYGALAAGHVPVAILQCTACYPVRDLTSMNLRVIESYRRVFPCVVGLSDHECGVALPLVAYGLGARIVEKHFTLDRTMRGPDHKASIEPAEFAALARSLRDAHEALGSGIKLPQQCEEPAMEKLSKKIVAARDLPAGHVIGLDDLAYKSPGNGGLPPVHADAVLGRALTRTLVMDDAVTFDMLAPPSEEA